MQEPVQFAAAPTLPPLAPVEASFVPVPTAWSVGVPEAAATVATATEGTPTSTAHMFVFPTAGGDGVPIANATVASATVNATAMVPTAGSTAIVEVDGDGRPMSPRARRKRSHNAVEVKRRQRISDQLDRLKQLLECPRGDEASVLSEAVTQIHQLDLFCNTLEAELATLSQGDVPIDTSADASADASAAVNADASADVQTAMPIDATAANIAANPVEVTAVDMTAAAMPVDIDMHTIPADLPVAMQDDMQTITPADMHDDMRDDMHGDMPVDMQADLQAHVPLQAIQVGSSPMPVQDSSLLPPIEQLDEAPASVDNFLV